MGPFLVGVFALLLGLALGALGVFAMVQAGSFASAGATAERGPLGLWGSASESASVPTLPWAGLVLALVGAVVLLAGLRGMLAALNGRPAQ